MNSTLNDALDCAKAALSELNKLQDAVIEAQNNIGSTYGKLLDTLKETNLDQVAVARTIDHSLSHVPQKVADMLRSLHNLKQSLLHLPHFLYEKVDSISKQLIEARGANNNAPDGGWVDELIYNLRNDLLRIHDLLKEMSPN